MSALSAFVGGLGLGVACAAVFVVWWVTRQQHLSVTGVPGTPSARVLPPPPQAEEVVRKEWRATAIERGAKQLMELAARNGQMLTMEQARDRAAEIYDDIAELPETV